VNAEYNMAIRKYQLATRLEAKGQCSFFGAAPWSAAWNAKRISQAMPGNQTMKLAGTNWVPRHHAK
jgi:hypothetical protein